MNMEGKTAINARVQARYDELRAEGKHGHYECMFRVVHEERARATRRSAAGAQPQDDHAGSPAPSRVDLPARVVDTVAASVGLSGPFGQDFYDFAQALMMEVLARVPAPSAQSSKAALSDDEIDAVVEEHVYTLRGWDYGGMKVIEVNGYREYEFARAILARAGITRKPLTEDAICEMRRAARNDPRCVDQHWFVLLVRAVEQHHGITPQAGKESGDADQA